VAGGGRDAMRRHGCREARGRVRLAPSARRCAGEMAVRAQHAVRRVGACGGAT